MSANARTTKWLPTGWILDTKIDIADFLHEENEDAVCQDDANKSEIKSLSKNESLFKDEDYDWLCSVCGSCETTEGRRMVQTEGDLEQRCKDKGQDFQYTKTFCEEQIKKGNNTDADDMYDNLVMNCIHDACESGGTEEAADSVVGTLDMIQESEARHARLASGALKIAKSGLMLVAFGATLNQCLM